MAVRRMASRFLASKLRMYPSQGLDHVHEDDMIYNINHNQQSNDIQPHFQGAAWWGLDSPIIAQKKKKLKKIVKL